MQKCTRHETGEGGVRRAAEREGVAFVLTTSESTVVRTPGDHPSRGAARFFRLFLLPYGVGPLQPVHRSPDRRRASAASFLRSFPCVARVTHPQTQTAPTRNKKVLFSRATKTPTLTSIVPQPTLTLTNASPNLSPSKPQTSHAPSCRTHHHRRVTLTLAPPSLSRYPRRHLASHPTSS